MSSMSLESLLLAAALSALGTLIIQRLNRIEKSVDDLKAHVALYLPPFPKP